MVLYYLDPEDIPVLQIIPNAHVHLPTKIIPIPKGVTECLCLYLDDTLCWISTDCGVFSVDFDDEIWEGWAG